MGTNTLVYLPGDVRVSDVADVMGILAGLPHKRGRYSEEVDGVKVTPTISPEMCEITLSGKMYDKQTAHRASFHFEVSDTEQRAGVGEGQRLLYCGSDNDFWRAIGDGVARFFGGAVDFCDCDDIDTDVLYKKPRKHNNPSNDPEWGKFWDEVGALESLGAKEHA